MAEVKLNVEITVSKIEINTKDNSDKCNFSYGGIVSVYRQFNGEWFEIKRGYTKDDWYLFQLILKEYFNEK